MLDYLVQMQGNKNSGKPTHFSSTSLAQIISQNLTITLNTDRKTISLVRF